jgi:UDP-glucose 4-epimerase
MKRHNILVTGGCGFIGTQVVHKLSEDGHKITIVDRNALGYEGPGTVVEEDYAGFLKNNTIKYDTIVHLAAEHIVPQSLSEPEKYYTNNVIKMKAMLDHMIEVGIKNIIFSSTGNLYGRQGRSTYLTEDMYYDPENPYASSKAAGELLIKDYARAYGINYVTFRYFNAAGADPAGRFGYKQRPATHVIPIMCNKIINSEIFQVFGNNYLTKDGTCVRDYVHVADLANAHSKALALLNAGKGNELFNLGGGSGGISLKELIVHVGDVVGKKPVFEYAAPRPGDPATLIANIKKAENILGWIPKYNIKDVILHAWNWENKHKNIDLSNKLV